MFVAVSLVARQQMQSNSVRALATTGAKRSQLLPELPTIAESGYPNIVLGSWNGFFAPARTPRPILEKINGEVLRALQQPKVRERLIALGQEFQPLDLAGYHAFVEADLKRWSALVDQIGRERLVAGP
jgi:tripartite-type tricarboxylate transporter receptor subunit TctC